jgi:polynucleotide 5'-kinase involved in rRNA processing
MASMTAPYPDLDRVLSAVRAAGQGAVLVLGAVDTGKTVLVRQVASALAARGPVWVVSADPGQAWIGPPTTLARVRLRRPPRAWLRLKPERLAMLGSTSPAACPALAAELLARLASEGIPARERVLVDTPGLVSGALAVDLWRRVAKGLRPSLVIAIRRGRELGPVLRPFRAVGSRVLSVAPDPRVRVRNRTMRTAYRASAYRRYFRGAAWVSVDVARVRVIAAMPRAPAALDLDRLVALRDAAGCDLALGVVRSVEPRRIGVVTPLRRVAAVTALVVGAIRLDVRTGEEMMP